MTDLIDLGDGRWRCGTTGLVLVRTPPHPLYRVFQTQYSALNPRIPPDDPTAWSRFDVPDAVTLYGADEEVAAICEVLAYAKPADLRLHEIFSDLVPDADPVGDEWQELGHMQRGQIARSWRVARQVTTITAKAAAGKWCVDLLHGESIEALRAEVATWSPGPELVEDPLKVDVSLLTSGRREITTAAASWVSRRTLCDGSIPAGIRFGSKHGANYVCWALWVPLLGTTDQSHVPGLASKRVTAGKSHKLLENFPALRKAASILRVRVH